MNRNQKASLAVIAAAAIAGAAYATTTIENDAKLALQAKTSLGQAVATAEQHAKGRAARAEIDQSDKGLVYEVEVVAGPKVFDIEIDATTGEVIKVSEDANDSYAGGARDQDD